MQVVKHILFLTIAVGLFGCQEGSQQTSKIDKSKTLPFFNSAEFTPEWIEEGTDAYDKIHTVAEFSLMDQDSQVVTNATFKDKIYIADFFFTRCRGICPKLTGNMAKLAKIYKDDDEVMLLSHTVMPWVDSIPVLKQYAFINDIDASKWHLVTGDRDKIYDLARNSYFADEDFAKTQDENSFIHTENFVLVDKKGRIRGVYNGTVELEIQRIMKHIAILKNEG